MMRAQERVLSLEGTVAAIEKMRSQGKTVIQCHGCFDVLHVGHLRHFEAAKQAADILVVTVTPDQFVNKGPGRPIFEARLRAELIAGLKVVDYVSVNRWASALEAIEILKPDFFAKGSEYEAPDQKVNPLFAAERATVEKFGGQVFFTREWTSSSSRAIESMRAGA
jgi:rfaE bifunctional protein nucleotidyltransferase chain/domain